jgi:hypothetical protein
MAQLISSLAVLMALYIQLAKRSHAHHNPTLTGCASQTREGDEMQIKFHNDPLAKRMLQDATPR